MSVYDSDDQVDFIREMNTIQKSRDLILYFGKQSKRDNVVGAWQICKLMKKIEQTDIDNDKPYIVQFIHTAAIKQVAEYELAALGIPTYDDLKELGTRVIARRRTEDMPYRLDESNRKIQLFDSNDQDFYPGIISCLSESRYLIFFDDGIVQFIKPKYIRRVLGNDRHNHAHWNAKPFFDFFLAQTNRKEVRPEVGQKCSIELNGNIKVRAKFVKVDALLGFVHFEEANQFEWIYLGSPRISQLFRALIKAKSVDKIIDYKTYNTCLSIDNDNEVIETIDLIDDDSTDDESLLFQAITSRTVSLKHKCSHKCVELKNGKQRQLQKFSALQRPLLTGWKRLGRIHRYYTAPCGKNLKTMYNIDQFLLKTNSKLRIDSFDLSKNCIIHKETVNDVDDISRGVEKITIGVRGSMSTEDKSFKYINNYNFDYVDVDLKNDLGRAGCQCTDNCRDKIKCSCWQLTVKRLIKQPNQKDFKDNINVAYDLMRHTDIVCSGIVECGSNCKCCADKCVNRVVQNGLQHKLELFMTKNKGWGVRAVTDIPVAMFVCEYTGDILENSIADKRDTKYQFNLPRFLNDSIDSDSDSDLDDEPNPKRFRVRSDDVVQQFISYIPISMHFGNAIHFPQPDKKSSSDKNSYVIDAMNRGNISRFFNHSCDPNLFIQCVYVDDDKRFPRIAFFTSELIKAGKELTIDYGYRPTPCHCDDCQPPKA